MSKTITTLVIGWVLGMLFCIFTGVEDHKLIQHNIAYYDKTTGDLTWSDTNTTVH
jgi:hypothetical protein